VPSRNHPATNERGQTQAAKEFVLSSQISLLRLRKTSAAGGMLGDELVQKQHPAKRRNQNSCPASATGEGFYQKVEPHLSMLHKFIRFRLRDIADADDVLQETLLHAFSHLDQLRSRDCLRAWLVQIAINEARKTLRSKQRTPICLSIDAPGLTDEHGHFALRQIPDWHETPSQMLERMELITILRKKLESLRPKWRELILLCDVRELNVGEAARRLGISLADARSSLYRARFALRDLVVPVFREASDESGDGFSQRASQPLKRQSSGFYGRIGEARKCH
jgi:RNA polymerase sigma-70 factor, ECF subfamily